MEKKKEKEKEKTTPHCGWCGQDWKKCNCNKQISSSCWFVKDDYLRSNFNAIVGMAMSLHWSKHKTNAFSISERDRLPSRIKRIIL